MRPKVSSSRTMTFNTGQWTMRPLTDSMPHLEESIVGPPHNRLGIDSPPSVDHTLTSAWLRFCTPRCANTFRM